MAKDTYYFPHDYNSRNDPKLQKVLQVLSHEGKSVFWDLVEMLYENGGSLLLSECDSYAFALRTDSELIKRLINEFGLFESDGVKFWSNSINRRLDVRSEKSEKARESAFKRWNNANALRTQSERNAIKERKGKERESSALPFSFQDLENAVLANSKKKRFSGVFSNGETVNSIAAKFSYIIRDNGMKKANGKPIDDLEIYVHGLLEKELSFGKK